MNYDKRNGDVCFREDDHAYFNEKQPDICYTSVTTLIGKYHEKFDGEFWARYKAFEECLCREDFIIVKSKYLRNRKADLDWFDKYNIDIEKFNSLVDANLAKYKLAGEVGCARGSEYHLKKELAFYEKESHELKTLLPSSAGSFHCQKHNWDLTRDKAVIPEFLVYYHSPDGLLNIAGQIDLMIKDGNDIYILDYKTNAKGIKDKPIYDPTIKKYKTMYYPINNLNDTMLVHYTLQLSLYAWMIQKLHPEFNIKLLKLLHIDGNDIETDYEVPYLKEDVERLLKQYKKTLQNERHR